MLNISTATEFLFLVFGILIRQNTTYSFRYRATYMLKKNPQKPFCRRLNIMYMYLEHGKF